MSENTNNSHFDGIKNSILSATTNATVTKDGESSIVSFSGINYAVTDTHDETVNFNVLDIDFAISPDGEINMIELEDGQVHVYEVEEGAMRDHLLTFLAWRSEVLSTVGV